MTTTAHVVHPWGRKPAASIRMNRGHWAHRGLVGLWDFREGAGATSYVTWPKSVPTIALDTATWTVHTKIGVGLSTLAANTDDVTISNDTSYNFDKANPHSLLLWGAAVATERFTAQKMSIPVGPAVQGWQIGIETTGKASYMLRGAGGGSERIFVQSDTTTWGDGNPHMLVTTYDGSVTAAGVKIYGDGALLAVTVSTDALVNATTHTDPIRIQKTSSTQYYTGQTYRLAIWNRVLTYGEVVQLYAMPWSVYQPKRSMTALHAEVTAAQIWPALSASQFVVPYIGRETMSSMD